MNVHCGASGCQYENEDGLLYAYLSDAAIHVLQHHTVASQLTTLSSSTASATETNDELSSIPQPLVLRYEWEPTQVQVLSGTSVGIGSAWGFRPIPANTSNFTSVSFEVSVHLMPDTTDSHAAPTRALLTLEVGGAPIAGGGQTTVLKPMGAAKVSWTINLAPYAAKGPAAAVELAVTATTGGSEGADWREATQLARRLRVIMHVGEWGCVPTDTTPKANLCSSSAQQQAK
jgi:hypothetical protein